MSRRSTTEIILLTLWLSLLGCTGTTPQVDSSPPSVIAPEPEASQTQLSSSKTAAASSQREPEVGITAALSQDELWSRLQQPDSHYFVLMRHAIAPGTGDPENFVLDDCSTQRNLSDKGRTQAKATGEAFKQRNIAVDQVLSSQWCRCLETAELLDLETVEPFPALNSFFRDRTTRTEQTNQVNKFMITHPNTSGVTLLVTHFVNITALAGSGVSSGEMVVMQINDQEQLEVLGQISPF